MKPLLYALFLWTLSGPAFAAPTQEAIRYYEDGLSYFNQEQYDSAVIQLKNALQISPDYLPARLLMGEALLLQGDGAAAEKEIRIAQRTGGAPSLTLLPLAKALHQQRKYEVLLTEIPEERLPPEQLPEILFLRGKAYLELGKLEEAKNIFARALQIPGGSKALPTVGLAILELKQRRLQKADEIADRALLYDPENEEAWNAKGAIAYARGDLEQAVSHFTRCLQQQPQHYTAKVSRASALIELKRNEEAIRELNQLGIASKWDPQISYYLAVAKRQSGDLQGAKEELQKAAGLVNSVTYEKVRGSSHMLLIGGLINYSNGELEKARRFLSDYIAKDKDNIIALKLLGATLLRMGEPNKAIPVLQRATELVPNRSELHRQLAEAYFRAGRFDKAIWSLETADRLAPGQTETLLQMGVAHLAVKKGKKGVDALEAAYRAAPDSVQAALLLSTVHLGFGNAGRAKEILQPLVSRMPENPTLANMLATAYLQAGDSRSARQWYQKALNIQPDFRPAIINLAQLDARENKIDSARQALQGLLSKEPENPRLLYELANLERRVGSIDEAIRLMENAYEFNRDATYIALRLIDLYIEAGNPNRALEIGVDLRRREPENFIAHQAVGKVQVALGDTQAAQAAFKNAVKLAGFDTQALYKIAQLQMRGGLLDEARWSLQKAIKGDSEFLPALFALVELEIRMNKLDSAAELLKTLSARAGDNPAVSGLRGDLAFRKKEFERAVENYDKALETNSNPTLALRRFQARIATGDSAKALQELAAWVERYPQGGVARMALAETYHAAGRLQQAKAHYEQLLQQGIETPALFNNLANLYADLEDPRAREFANKAYQLAPADANVIDTLGWLLVKGGQVEEGLGYLRDASARSPKQAEIRYHLAVALEKLGRVKDARTELQLALKLSDRFPGREDALKRLAELNKSR